MGPRCDPQRRPSANWVSLPLRIRDADRCCGLHHLVHVRGAARMTSWPILSVVTFLPLLGALFIASLNDDEDGVHNARWVALWTTLITFAVSLILLWRFDPSSAEFQFTEKYGWLGGSINYSM